MKTNTTLHETIKNHSNLVVTGLEGISKTRSLISILKKEYCDNGKAIVLAFKSYSIMLEKQKEIMEAFAMTEQEVPIVAAKKDSKGIYSLYHTNPETPNMLNPEAKILLMTQKCLQLRGYANFDWQEDMFKKELAAVVVDEFDLLVGICPNAHYQAVRFVESNWFAGKDSTKDSFEAWMKENYCFEDRVNCERDKYGYQKAHWITELTQQGTKIIFGTSEMTATLLLKSMGFEVFVMPNAYNFKHQTIHAFPCALNRHFFDRMNEEQAWNELKTKEHDFKYVISDRFDVDLCPLNDLEIINHSSVRGSNSMAGNEILTLLSYIPDSSIQLIKDVINFHSPSSPFSFEKIKALFYRDRLMQAVGRVLGFRSQWKVQNETWLFVHFEIYNMLKAIQNDPAYNLAYTIKEWIPVNPVIHSLLQRVKQDMQCENDAREAITLSDKEKKKAQYKALFEVKEGARIDYEKVKEVLGGNAQPKQVAKFFDLETCRTSTVINGKIVKYSYIKNLALKEVAA